MTAPNTVRRTPLQPWPSAWWLALAISLLAVGALEATLLEVGLGYFTSGYGGAYIQGVLPIAGFGLASLALDGFLVLSVWTLVALALRPLRAGSLRVFCTCVFLGLVVPLSLDFARYMVDSILGRMTSLALLWELSGRSVWEVIAQSLAQLPPLGWLAAFAGLGSLALFVVVRGLERRLEGGPPALQPPALRALGAAALACAVAGSLALAAPGGDWARVQAGLVRKPSAVLLRSLVQRLTDLDRDGAGLLSVPPDPAPLDGSVHAYALDVPGNGVDENRLAGDHPSGHPPVPVVPVPAEIRGPYPPAVLLIYLETFRADLIGARLGGLEVTPFLNRLAREGAKTERAYAHTPHTFESRVQLFAGALAHRPGLPTLVDDFQRLGFEVAHFSGQDEAYAGSAEVLGVERADHFYDARSDIERHVGRGTSRGALQVSWKLLNARVGEWLDARDRSRPLFLYLNFTDCHFPFHHEELDDLLGVAPISRHAIRPDRRDEVWATYANAAANVDRGIERLLARVRAHLGGREPAVVVTADHGEALYERALLGHGQRLDDVQTRVPLIVWGLGGEWPEPLGAADLRGLLLRSLGAGREAGSRPRARFVPDPERRVLQYLSRADRPRLLGLRSLEGGEFYSFATGRVDIVGPDERPVRPSPERRRAAFERLIWSWESLRLALERDR